MTRDDNWFFSSYYYYFIVSVTPRPSVDGRTDPTCARRNVVIADLIVESQYTHSPSFRESNIHPDATRVAVAPGQQTSRNDRFLRRSDVLRARIVFSIVARRSRYRALRYVIVSLVVYAVRVSLPVEYNRYLCTLPAGRQPNRGTCASPRTTCLPSRSFA